MTLYILQTFAILIAIFIILDLWGGNTPKPQEWRCDNETFIYYAKGLTDVGW